VDHAVLTAAPDAQTCVPLSHRHPPVCVEVAVLPKVPRAVAVPCWAGVFHRQPEGLELALAQEPVLVGVHQVKLPLCNLSVLAADDGDDAAARPVAARAPELARQDVHHFRVEFSAVALGATAAPLLALWTVRLFLVLILSASSPASSAALFWNI
jgi:hypothetical protein